MYKNRNKTLLRITQESTTLISIAVLIGEKESPNGRNEQTSTRLRFEFIHPSIRVHFVVLVVALTNKHTHIHTHTQTHVHTHTHTYIHTQTHTHIHTCTHIHTRIHTHTYITHTHT